MSTWKAFFIPNMRHAAIGILVILGLYLVSQSLLMNITLWRPIPYWDQWEFVKSIPRIYAHQYSLADLFSQHNEHRIFTARVVFILDLIFFAGTSFLSVIVLHVTLMLIAALFAIIISKGPALRLCLFLLIWYFVLSPTQWENLSSGFQVQFPFVDLFVILSTGCLIWSLDVASRRQALLYAAAASLLDFLAVFSMASGVLAIVPALFAGLLLRRRSKILFLYLIAHVLFCALFFYGYNKGDAIAPTYNPLFMTHYVMIYLGASLRGYGHTSLLLGAIDLLLLALAVWRLGIKASRERGAVTRVEVLVIATAVFIVCAAYLTAFGRGSLGLESATSARYAIQSILLQMCLFTFYWREAVRFGALGIPVQWLRTGMLLGLLILSLISGASPLSIKEWKDRISDLDTAGFALSNGVFSDHMLGFVYPYQALVQTPLRMLASRRMSLFSPEYAKTFRPPSNLIADWDPNATRDCTAQFGATRVGPTWIELDGWIYNDAQPAEDGWVLVLDHDDADRIVGFGRQSLDRPDVQDAMKVTISKTGFLIGLNSPRLADEGHHAFTVVLVPRVGAQPLCQATLETELAKAPASP